MKVKGFVCCNEGNFYFFSTLLKVLYIVLVIWPSFLIGIGGICENFVESIL